VPTGSAPDGFAAQPELRWARDAADLQGAIAVRERVFIEEQGVAAEEELDGFDADALHLVALGPKHVIATLRLVFDGDTVKVGRVAVDRAWRRRGIAARMLELALAEARARGARRARLASQLDVVTLYERAGFAVESDVFEEAGIPHVWMGLELRGDA
jgi:predicted GNAT family N-acyltransferase